MSQAGIINIAGGGGGGSPVQTLTGDSGGAVSPTANNIFILADDSSINNDNGATVIGTPGTSTLTVTTTNRTTGTVTTADATLTTIITFSLGATPGAFYVYGNVQAFDSATSAAGTYSFSGGFRTDGATATELGTELHDEFEDPSLVTSDIFITASGNNVLLQVQGVAATSINWNGLMEYRRVI